MKLVEVPPFCLQRIAGFLDLDDLGLFGQASAFFRNFFRSDELWRDRIQTEFGDASRFDHLPGDSWLEKYRLMARDTPEKIAMFKARFKPRDDGMYGRLNTGRDLAGCCLRGELDSVKERVEVWKMTREVIQARDRTVSFEDQFRQFKPSLELGGPFDENMASLFDEKSLSELLSVPLKATGFVYYGNYSGTHEAGVCFEAEPPVRGGFIAGRSLDRHLPAVARDGTPAVAPGTPLDVARGQFCPQTFSRSMKQPRNVPAAHRAPALCWAAMGGHINVCEYLLDELNVDGQAVIPAYAANALDVALANGHFQLARFLRSRGVTRGECRNVDGCVICDPPPTHWGSALFGRLSCVHSPLPPRTTSPFPPPPRKT